MSDVAHALSRLGQVVRNLEGSVETLEGNLTGEQRDMFGVPLSEKPAGLSGEDKEIVTQKLDLAINKIEEILSEDLSEKEGQSAHG